MKHKKRHIVVVACIIFILFGVIGYRFSSSIMVRTASAKISEMEVHYINVGHGDSIIIKYPHGKIVLIDAGKEEYGGKIVKYLKSMNVDKIDYVIASHYDMDHIGGMPAVLENFQVGSFYGPYYREELKIKNSHYKLLIGKLKEKNIKLNLARTGMVMNIDGVENYILSPVKKNYKYPNDHSIVMKTIYNKTSFLFTGDLQREGETEAIKRHGRGLDADVLKVGHHGYEGSSSKRFLELVTPKVSIISGGNTEKAPIYSKDVYDRLKKVGSEVFSTYEDGNVIVISDGINLFSKTEYDEFE